MDKGVQSLFFKTGYQLPTDTLICSVRGHTQGGLDLSKRRNTEDIIPSGKGRANGSGNQKLGLTSGYLGDVSDDMDLFHCIFCAIVYASFDFLLVLVHSLSSLRGNRDTRLEFQRLGLYSREGQIRGRFGASPLFQYLAD